ncbi:GNAT family N-acetyltransferase [Coralliovum pocilloporae]|uniref:GNAT family N-acetyltransferase n=1 Tax=Coralliovum pocilloporae TaxID=3066369 RepID=UPI00330744E4
MILRDDKLVGVLPAAKHPSDPTTVISHPGSSYGGILHDGYLSGEIMVTTLQAICDHYQAAGCKELIYKAVPSFYHRSPAMDDSYALFRLGADRYRVDLSVTIDLDNRRPIGSRRKRGVKKAVKAGLEIQTGAHLLPAYWDVVTANLADRHDTRPVHTLDEIQMLADRFPDTISCTCALKDGVICGGLVNFLSPMVMHSQYIASTAAGRDCNALDMVFEHCILSAREAGLRYFDFGICTEDNGTYLNAPLYTYKHEFGSGATVHEFYRLTF